jgi:hypothetical protein
MDRYGETGIWHVHCAIKKLPSWTTRLLSSCIVFPLMSSVHPVDRRSIAIVESSPRPANTVTVNVSRIRRTRHA